MELRDYQSSLSRRTRVELKHNRKTILQSSTGSGKTRIATDFVDRACEKEMTTVFLADRKELLTQTVNHFNKLGISCQLITSETKTIYKSKVYVGMIESFFRRFSKGMFDGIKIDLFIFDECHIGNYYKLIDLLKPHDPYIIGLTATPVASSKNHQLKKYYNSIVCGPSTKWLVENKFLVPSIDIGYNKLLDLKVMAGEFSSASQIQQFSSLGLNHKMFDLWRKHASDRQTIVYNINIAHNAEVAKIFRDAGYDVGCISSETPPEERAETLLQYEKGLLQVLCNVGILTKGYDSPETSCIVANFSTASLSKWFQVVGRGARTFSGKNNFITIDMGNNILLHGSYNDDVDWGGLFQDESRDRNFTVKIKPKLCNLCFAYIFNIHIKECPVCLKPINIKELLTMEDSMPPELLLKTPDQMTLLELYQYAKHKGYKRGYAWTLHLKNVARRQNGRLPAAATKA